MHRVFTQPLLLSHNCIVTAGHDCNVNGLGL